MLLSPEPCDIASRYVICISWLEAGYRSFRNTILIVKWSDCILTSWICCKSSWSWPVEVILIAFWLRSIRLAAFCLTSWKLKLSNFFSRSRKHLSFPYSQIGTLKNLSRSKPRNGIRLLIFIVEETHQSSRVWVMSESWCSTLISVFSARYETTLRGSCENSWAEIQCRSENQNLGYSMWSWRAINHTCPKIPPFPGTFNFHLFETAKSYVASRLASVLKEASPNWLLSYSTCLFTLDWKIESQFYSMSSREDL